jgi:hypothetical protein
VTFRDEEKVKKRPNEEKKRYGPFSKCMKVKPECEFQKTMIKFMQVRDGETRKSGKSVPPSSVKEIDEIKELAINPPH